MVPRWRIFGDFLHPVFSVSHMQHISELHSKFALRPHHVWKYGKTSNMQRLRIGDKKRRKKKKKKEEIFDITNQLFLKVWTQPIRNNIRVLVLSRLELCSDVTVWKHKMN